MHWLSCPLIKVSPQRVLIPILFKCTIMLHHLASMQKQQGRKQEIHRASLRLGIISLYPCCFSVTKLCPTLRPRELQHTRLPCPSLSPRVCSNSYPLSQWCHPTITSSVSPFSSCPQSLPVSGYFPVSWLFTSGGQSIGDSTSESVLPMNIQSWFPLGLTVCSPCCPRDSQESSPAPQFKSINLRCSAFFMLSPTLVSVHDYWRNHSFDYIHLCQESDVSAF